MLKTIDWGLAAIFAMALYCVVAVGCEQQKAEKEGHKWTVTLYQGDGNRRTWQVDEIWGGYGADNDVLWFNDDHGRHVEISGTWVLEKNE